MTARKDLDLAAFGTRLATLREALVREGTRSAEERQPVEADPSRTGRLGRMEVLQAQELALEAERRRAAEITRIDAAVQRIAAGEYGICLSCGVEISAKRLETDPAAPLCIDCARQAKRPRG